VGGGNQCGSRTGEDAWGDGMRGFKLSFQRMGVLRASWVGGRPGEETLMANQQAGPHQLLFETASFASRAEHERANLLSPGCNSEPNGNEASLRRRDKG
jgi:hypothetical protein